MDKSVNRSYGKQLDNILKDLNKVISDEINQIANNIKKAGNELKEQGVMKRLGNIVDNISSYIGDNSALKILKDVRNVAGDVIVDSIGSLFKLGYNATTSPETLAKIYKITQEEAIQIQAILGVLNASEFRGNKKKGASNVADLAIDGKKIIQKNILQKYYKSECF